MGLFSRKNKDFTGSPTSADGSDGETTGTGAHRHNTLHKRPPTNTSNETPTTQTSDGAHPDVALGTVPRGRSVSPTYNAAGAGNNSAAHNTSGAPYAEGGEGFGGTRRADAFKQPYAEGGQGFGGTTRADQYNSGGADDYSSQQQQQQQQQQQHTYGEASGNPGVMSNQVYERHPGGVGNGTAATGAGAAGLGAGAALGAGGAERGLGHNQNATGAVGPQTTSGPQAGRNPGISSNQAGIGAGQQTNANRQGAGIPTAMPTTVYGGHDAGAHEGFAHETMESARAKVRAAEEAEAAALGLVAEARRAAKEAKEIIERLSLQAEEEARLASIKQQEAMTLRQGAEHLGRSF